MFKKMEISRVFRSQTKSNYGLCTEIRLRSEKSQKQVRKFLSDDVVRFEGQRQQAGVSTCFPSPVPA